MLLASRLGTFRYYQIQGQGYTDMFRGSFTASGLVTAGAAWLGVGKGWALAIGVASIGFWIVLSCAFGYAVVRWRVLHRTLKNEWDNTPYLVRHIELLEQIECNTGAMLKWARRE